MLPLQDGKGIVRPVAFSCGDIDTIIRGGNFRLFLNVGLGTDVKLVRLCKFT
jgi:hypothetical protein